MTHSDDELEEYPDNIFSKDAKVHPFLKLTYIILPIWGIITLYIYWNGSHGWLDRGYWGELQKAANTTFPSVNLNDPDVREQLKEDPQTKSLQVPE